MGSYNHDQTVFSLSLMANLGSGLTGSVDQIETALAADINQQLQTYQAQLGPWKVIWGPAVYQQPLSDRADNAMFVAQNGSDPTDYVIAIAGTNPYSVFDWLVEDAFVSRQVAWEYGNPPAGLNPCLADGTHLGLSIVESMQPGPSLPGTSTTLDEFLQSLPPGALKLNVAGHSLGGALSPVTALWLSDTQSQWDPAKRATLSCLPSAGPTPGNQDFATYYASSPLGKATNRIHNSIDVVPHAWTISDLDQIPSLYQPNIPASPLVNGLVFLAKEASEDGDYSQLMPNAPALPGTVETNQIDPNASNFKNFVVQMAYQHVDEYLILMGVDALLPELARIREGAQLLGLQGATAALQAKLVRKLIMAGKLKLLGIN
jgi:hypothetical protein